MTLTNKIDVSYMSLDVLQAKAPNTIDVDNIVYKIGVEDIDCGLRMLSIYDPSRKYLGSLYTHIAISKECLANFIRLKVINNAPRS